MITFIWRNFLCIHFILIALAWNINLSSVILFLIIKLDLLSLIVDFGWLLCPEQTTEKKEKWKMKNSNLSSPQPAQWWLDSVTNIIFISNIFHSYLNESKKEHNTNDYFPPAWPLKRSKWELQIKEKKSKCERRKRMFPHDCAPKIEPKEHYAVVACTMCNFHSSKSQQTNAHMKSFQVIYHLGKSDEINNESDSRAPGRATYFRKHHSYTGFMHFTSAFFLLSRFHSVGCAFRCDIRLPGILF